MNTKTQFFLILLAVFLIIQAIPLTNCQESEENEEISFDVTVEVWDIDLSTKNVNLTIKAETYNFPYETSFITLEFIGSSGSTTLRLINEQSAGYFRDTSEMLQWKLIGRGENFPFDSYFLEVKLHGIGFDDEKSHNYTFTLEAKNANHKANLLRSDLRDVWMNTKWLMPHRVNNNTLTVNFERKNDSTILLSLQFILPSAVCFYLLGVSCCLSPKKLNERLMVYLPIFFFVPTFLFAIQDFLPYRTSLAYPEFLSICLLSSTAVFVMASIIGHENFPPENIVRLNEENDYILSRKWDMWAAIISMIIYLILNFYSVSNTLIPAGFIFVDVFLIRHLIPIIKAIPRYKKRAVITIILANITFLILFLL